MGQITRPVPRRTNPTIFVERTTKFELAINLKNAKSLGLTVQPRSSPAPTDRMSARKANGGENVRLHCPYMGEKEQAMLRADAQRAVIREWLALPADERKTKEQAVAYAMTDADRFKFRGCAH